MNPQADRFRVEGHCAADRKCIASTPKDQERLVQCASCKRIWHLGCRLDGAVLWERRLRPTISNALFFKYWACSRTRCKTETDRMKATALDEPELIVSDSEELQITKVSGPSSSVTAEPKTGPSLGSQNRQAGPSDTSRLNLDDDIYGRVPEPPLQPHVVGIPHAQSFGAGPSTFQPYARPAHLAHSTASVRMRGHEQGAARSASQTLPAQPDAGASTSRSRPPLPPLKASRKTPRAEDDRPWDRSPGSARKRVRTQSPDIPGFLGPDAPPHVISSDDDEDAKRASAKVSQNKSYSNHQNSYGMPQANSRLGSGSREPAMPVSQEPTRAAPLGPPLQSLSRRTSSAPRQLPRYVPPRRSPSPPRPRPFRQYTSRTHNAVMRGNPPRVPSATMPLSPPAPSPPPDTRERSPTPLSPSAKEALIRAHQDELRAKRRLEENESSGMQAATGMPDNDFDMHDEMDADQPEPATPSGSRRAAGNQVQRPTPSNNTQGYRSVGEDQASSSDGEFGAWARPPYSGKNASERSPGGAITLEDWVRGNTGVRRGAAQTGQQRGRGGRGRGSIFIPPAPRGRGAAPRRGAGARGGTPLQAQVPRGRGRGRGAAPPVRRRSPSPIAVRSRINPPPDDLADDEEEDMAPAPRRPRPRPVKKHPATLPPPATGSDDDAMQLDDPAPMFDNAGVQSSRSPSGSPLFTGPSDDGEKPLPGQERFKSASRRTMSSTFSALNLDDAPTYPRAKRMSAVRPPPTPSSKRRRSPLTTHTVEELRKLDPTLIPTWPPLPDEAPEWFKNAPSLEEAFLPTMVRIDERIDRWDIWDKKLAERIEKRREKEERRREKEKSGWALAARA